MNEIVNKFLLTSDKFMPEIHLRIRELKDNNIQHNLKWCIASNCLTEKLTIIKADSESLLNTRDELVP